ncbi:hypothetical protein GGX14DRAFT_379958 [Mycena pura]|uniref:CxC2-like cysteine cluster KDZ transposase-associated domain-containing protein n=1 Tax=Mycena pura TaxID=153505 RepID=A0AAD6UR01_9AGAR|nr:hypothetical protein GGX14DRAFT_379958 [Mycena pura]
MRTNVTLLRHGYIGASPEKVTLAFPLRLFEVFRQIHRVCPRYSIGGLSTTLTNLHQVPRRDPLAEQLSTAYDAYLEVIREVDARVDAAMARDASWHIQNVCAPCMYKTCNEPPLRFSWLGCMDGNNSLKLVDPTFRAGTTRPDDRASTSFRWLTPEQVDVFKDEVADSQKAGLGHAPVADNEDPDVAWLNINELSSNDSEELANSLNTCVERWKAAGPESRKKMFALFAVAGIFLTVCRHGHVVLMCDMIRSGELMKYPLAMVKWLLDRYGADLGLGYDIMCAFFKTLMRSSLGANVTAMRLRGVVPAFHGYAHNRACQLGWHPLYVDGVGLEDFEECERTFAQSNNLASTTRLATPFHRQQQIDEHFKFHDEDKHAGSGNFIYQNYRQALEKIASNTGRLSVLENSLGTSAADYEAYHAAEVEYFQDLRKEPDAASDQAKRDFARLDFNIINNGYTKPQIALVRTRYRTTYTKFLAVEEDLCRFEESHGIEVRWTPESQEYKDGLTLTTQRKYREASREVERLMVQRLMELTKLGMSGLAYNMREKISQALKTRSEAIRRAINVYNEAAVLLVPSREKLTFAQVMQMTSLAEFDILCDTREDVRRLPWTQPDRREASVLHFGIKGAKGEIRRLNVEITRLLTSLVDEHTDYYRAISATIIENPPLATELQRRWRHASRISTAICRRIALTSRLVGFSGSIFPGQREGRDPDRGEGVPPPSWLATELGVEQTTVEYEEAHERNEEAHERNVEPIPASPNDEDSGLVVSELELNADDVVQLMDHLYM